MPPLLRGSSRIATLDGWMVAVACPPLHCITLIYFESQSRPFRGQVRKDRTVILRVIQDKESDAD